jgi:methylamine dehydrogenase accessory protein MauD
MESGWLISYVILWMITLLLVAVVLAHSRLLGLLHYRVGPTAARQLADGPVIGTQLQFISGLNVNGEKWQMNFPSAGELILIFVSPQCSTCNETLPHIEDFSRSQNLTQIILMSTINDIGMNRAYVRYRNLEKLNFIINEDLADKLNIEAIPYALYIDKQGKVVAKGVVNNYENLIGLREIARKAELAAV